jgi:hypothetical protein
MITIESVEGIGNPSKYFTPPLPSSLGIKCAVTLYLPKRTNPQQTKKLNTILSSQVRRPNVNPKHAGATPNDICINMEYKVC